jgi:hypothetical protein
MLVLQLIALGLLLHEAVYLASRGSAHWRENTAPVLGLRLDRKSCVAVHVANVLSSIVLLIAPSAWFSPVMSMIVLTVLIAAFPCRLPNHLIVAWFFLGAFVLAEIVGRAFPPPLSFPTPFALGVIQGMTALLYGISGFHKLNTDFFSPRRSCGAGFVVYYLLQRGVRLNRWPWYATPLGIYFVVIAELILPVLLAIHDLRVVGLLLAVILHIAFGFLAHLHFSVIMFAGLASFLPQQTIGSFLLPSGLASVPILLGVPAGLILGNYLPCRHVESAKLNHAAFGVLCVAMIIYVVRSGTNHQLFVEAFREHPAAFCVMMFCFIANGLGPYLGVKQDFSLAMFSNLRMDHWCHFVVRRPLTDLSPRYLRVGLPMGCSGRPDVIKLFENRFFDRERQMFSIGYVLDSLKDIQRAARGAEPIRVWVSEAQGGEGRLITATDRPSLRVCERISVFPYALPVDPSTPVLS